MRRIVVYELLSLDGVAEAPDSFFTDWDDARAHLLEMAGDPAGARDSHLEAARRATNIPQQRYLHSRAARLG